MPNTVNSSVRTREYLAEAEIERLMAAARKSSRYGHRDATMILIGYRHGLRASERWSWPRGACTSAGPRTAHRARSRATKSALCAVYSANGGYPRSGTGDDAQSRPIVSLHT